MRTIFPGVKVHVAPSLFIFSNYVKISKIFKKILLAQIKCIVLKPSHIQGFLDNFKIERDISISLRKKWSWTPCMNRQIVQKTISMSLSIFSLLA